MDPADLERLIDRELRSLPAPRAPRALLPRVMAAVDDAARRPWYSRTWLQWPIAAQLASALVLIGVVAAGGVLLPQLRDAVATLSFVADFDARRRSHDHRRACAVAHAARAGRPLGIRSGHPDVRRVRGVRHGSQSSRLRKGISMKRKLVIATLALGVVFSSVISVAAVTALVREKSRYDFRRSPAYERARAVVGSAEYAEALAAQAQEPAAPPEAAERSGAASGPARSAPSISADPNQCPAGHHRRHDSRRARVRAQSKASQPAV